MEHKNKQNADIVAAGYCSFIHWDFLYQVIASLLSVNVLQM